MLQERQHRKQALIRTLVRYPLTAAQVLRASAAWERPYRSFTRVKEDLRDMVKAGFLARQEIPQLGSGKNPFLYYLRAKARLLVPEVAELDRANAVFRGLTEAPWHTLAASEFMTELERSTGEDKRVRVVEVFRPRQFVANVRVETRAGVDETKLIPDYTVVAMVNGKPEVLFVEVQHRTPLIMPVQEKSVHRSFRYKLTRYKAFTAEDGLQRHAALQHMERVLRARFVRFRVLIVTTGSELQKRNLIAAAGGGKWASMFWFTTLSEAKNGNVWSDTMWEQPVKTNRVALLA